MFADLGKNVESGLNAIPDFATLLSILDGSGVILLIAVLIELVFPIPPNMRLNRLSPFLRALATKVNLEKNSDTQKLFAGIMLPCVVFITAWAITLLLDAITGFDTLLALFILPFLLNSRAPLDTAWQIFFLLRHDHKEQARNVLQKKITRNCSRLSYMGLSKACCEYTIMAMASQWIAIMVWYALAGLEGALIMQMSSVMFKAFSPKNNPNYKIFSIGINRIQQFLLIPVVATCAVLAIFSMHPLCAFSAAMDASSKHPAPVSGFIEGLFGGMFDIALGGPREYGEILQRYDRLGGDMQPSAISTQLIAKRMRKTGLMFAVFCALISICS